MSRIKQLTALVLTIALLTTLTIATLTTYAAAETETLTIKGDGVEREITFTREELEKKAIQRYTYSVINNFPTERTDYVAGILLIELLNQAGLKESAQTIKFIASDGYQRTFTVRELFEPRYYFQAEGEKTPVPAIICLQSSTKSLDNLESSEMRLMMGQRAHSEQNNPWFVRRLLTIEVSTKEPEKWSEVTFDRIAGPEGVTLKLQHQFFDSVKIYYTTDGSKPTVDSKMYNISANQYQPQLNKPLVINKTVTVQAIAIGTGREDSAVSSIKISFDEPRFNDLGGYDWAKDAIEELAEKGIINGTGGSRFDPAGTVTRSMVVAILYRLEDANVGGSTEYGVSPESGAQNMESETQDQKSGNLKSGARNAESGVQDADSGAQKREFSDVKEDAWYAEAVMWAAEHGIAGGYSDGRFGPNDSISRQDLTVILARYADFSRIDMPQLREYKKFSDDTKIAGYASAAVERAYRAEIINGKGDSTFDPTGKSTRAELAVMMKRFLKRSSPTTQKCIALHAARSARIQNSVVRSQNYTKDVAQ